MDAWFETMRRTLEAAYLATDDARRGSGFSGTEERWTALRRPVADCVDRAGTFLDVGCANGYLLECVRRWAGDRGVSVELFGVDLSAALVARAHTRLAEHGAKLWVENAFTWTPPRRFDYVRTELVYVPAALEADYLRHLLRNYVSDGGSLLVANYLEGHPSPASHVIDGACAATDLCARLAELGFTPRGLRDGFDAEKARRTRVAIL